MDVFYFLKERTDFIRQLYRETSAPYLLRINKIENEEEPFVPPCWDSEDDEPPFIKEWMEAKESLDTLRLMYLSMLKSALHSYFQTWERQCHIQDKITSEYRKKLFKKGWFRGYENLFKEGLEINFQNSSIDLKVIEEIALARNHIEHPECISRNPQYNKGDYQTLRNLSYIDDISRSINKDAGDIFFFANIALSEEQLLSAITTIENFSEWFNQEIKYKDLRKFAKLPRSEN